MTAHYDTTLVLTSFLISVIAAYFVLNIASLIPQLPSQRARMVWIMIGSLCMAVGIWSMHFIGMVAFELPIPLIYDRPYTLVSLLPAVASSVLFLSVLSRADDRPNLEARALAAGIIGLGIASMHYTGMAAIVVSPPIRYDPILVIISVVVAILVAFAGLLIVAHVRRMTRSGGVAPRLVGALVMGGAIPIMHYTGMAAANFDETCRTAGTGFTPEILQFAVVLSSAFVLILGIAISSNKEALQKRDAQLAVYRLANERLYRAATRDPLTDCHNRRYFDEFAQSLLERERRDRRPAALMFLDIDHFKSINDRHGHAVGDKALCHLVELVRRHLRASDLLARIGGEEFAVLLPDVDGVGGWVIAERMRKGIATAAMPLPGGGLLPMTVSIGLAWATAPRVCGLDHLFREADAALYEAKGGGRNRSVVVEVGIGAAECRLADDGPPAPSEFKPYPVNADTYYI